LARKNYIQALKINPYNSPALIGLGNYHAELDSLIPAIQVL